MNTTQVITTIIEFLLVAGIITGKIFENKLIQFENKIKEVIRRK